MVLTLPFCGHSGNQHGGVSRTHVRGETENLPTTTHTSVVAVAANLVLLFCGLRCHHNQIEKRREGRSKRLKYEAIPIQGGVAYVCYVLTTKGVGFFPYSFSSYLVAHLSKERRLENHQNHHLSCALIA